MRRREFITGLLLAATVGRTQAQPPAKVYRVGVLSPEIPPPGLLENFQCSNSGLSRRVLSSVH